MAQAVRAYTPNTILGTDKDKDTERAALESGVLDGILDESALADCDLLILALYPRDVVDYVQRHAAHIKKGACVVDLCGIKRAICDRLVPLSLKQGFHFIGGHPMAGRETSGYAAATPAMFQNASMILIPHEETPADILARMKEFFSSLRFGRIVLTDEETHDEIIAYTSQLVHVLSNAFIKSPVALQQKGFSAGSFRDFTRVATVNANLWSQLFLDNRDFLIEEIDALCARLADYSQALRTGDEEKMHDLLQEGSDWKDKITASDDRAMETQRRAL